VSGVRIGHPARHYKGEVYVPLRLATGVEWDHLFGVDRVVRVPGFGPAIWAGDVPPSENRGPVVAYSRLSDDGAFARPVSEWLGAVVVEGREVARYEPLDLPRLIKAEARALALVDTIAAHNARMVTECATDAGVRCSFVRQIGDACDACPRHHLITPEAP
jgi:hypothetical protein